MGYRGAFGIDGVLTADGFRPTELNSRMSAGAGSLARAVDRGLLDLVQHNLVSGRDPGVTAEALEAWAVPAMDQARFLKATGISRRRVVEEPWDVRVDWDGARLRRSAAATDWSVSAGPTASGTYCRLVAPSTPPPGIRVAELNVALMRFLDHELDTGFGEVAAPPDVRPSLAPGPVTGNPVTGDR